MNFVEPIRDKNTLQNIMHYLKETNERDYIMFLIGIYAGFRISDILRLRVSDLRKKDFVNIKEQKTGKQKILQINPYLKHELADYLESKNPQDFIIKSRNGYNDPISRVRAYKILRDVGQKFHIENIGTHTLRKTFGYHFYKQTKDVVLLQEIFNHTDPSVTLRYIGINRETANNAIKSFKLF